MTQTSLFPEKTFTLFWKDGRSELIRGTSYDTALKNAGYLGKYIQKLDIFAIQDVRKDWEYCKETQTWSHK